MKNQVVFDFTIVSIDRPQGIFAAFFVEESRFLCILRSAACKEDASIYLKPLPPVRDRPQFWCTQGETKWNTMQQFFKFCLSQFNNWRSVSGRKGAVEA